MAMTCMTLPETKVRYQSRCYDPAKVSGVYISMRQGEIVVFECNAQNQTVRESIGNTEDFPADKIAKARELEGSWPNQVGISGHAIDPTYRPCSGANRISGGNR
jgi:hypothetical protein